MNTTQLSDADNQARKRVIAAFNEVRDDHAKFCRRVQQGYRAYRGVVDTQREIVEWTSKYQPPYAFQIIETITSNLIDERMRFEVKPIPKIESLQDIQDHDLIARALEIELRQQYGADRLDEKQRPLALQEQIAGFSPAKNCWHTQTGTRMKRLKVAEPIVDPDTGMTLGVQEVLKAQPVKETIFDGPSLEVISIEDFFWPSNARDQDSAEWFMHRVWMTKDQVDSFVKAGVFKAEWAAQLTYDGVEDTEEQNPYRDDKIYQLSRKKGLVEILEFWTKDVVIAVGNRDILLRNEPNPYWHAEKPFTVVSSSPDLFKLNGIATIDLIKDLQSGLWDVMNQRLDNMKLVNNAIFYFSSDLNPDDYEFYPGARWILDNPAQVGQWQPNPLPAQISINAEASIKGDIQNITGGMPMMAGIDSSIDSTTATGVSIMTNLAQKRLAAKKGMYSKAFERKVRQDISSLNQFMRSTGTLVPLLGKDGAREYLHIFPDDFSDLRFTVSVKAMSDELMTQERRAQVQQLLMTIANVAPAFAASGTPLNLKPALENYLHEYDINDTEQFFTAQPPQMGQAGQPAPNPAQQPGPQGAGPNGENLGITSSQATDASSPSNANSMSPVMALQRARTLSGGPNNQ